MLILKQANLLWEQLQTATAFAEEGLFSSAKRSMNSQNQTKIIIFIKDKKNITSAVRHAVNAINRLPARELLILLPDSVSDQRESIEELLSGHRIHFSMSSYSSVKPESTLQALSDKGDILYMYTDYSESFLNNLTDRSFPVVTFTLKETN